MWTKEEWEKECKETKANLPIKLKVYEAIYGLFAKTIFYDWYWKLYHWWYRKEQEQDHQDMISELYEENDSFIAEDGKEYSYSQRKEIK